MIKKDLGFVLKRYNFRETSLIAHIYTENYGKITGILKGFYTMKKEFSTPLDNYSLNEFIFYPKKTEIWLVSYADLVSDYSFLRTDLVKIHVAAVIFDVIDRVMQIWDKNQAVFNLVKECLTYLRCREERKLLYIFLIKFLTLAGVKPHLNSCLNCHDDLDCDVYFSISKGGLFCSKCLYGIRDIQRIGKETISCLRYIQRTEFPYLWRLSPSYKSEEEIFFILKGFIAYHLDYNMSINLEVCN
ncbi:MAG: DNA repair protein RecO [Candidatus Omnitrophica bacterium]|nr:DNA repair protein RecO [Candidatus Omnitrophota bacterium]